MSMPTGQRVDPYANFAFRVEIDGITQAYFRECSGLTSTIDVIENPEGGVGIIHKVPGRTKYANVVLKRGLTDSSELFDWHQAAVDGRVQRRNGSIVQLDPTGAEKVRWNFRDGWPSKWDGPTFNSGASEVSVETLEIAHEGLTRG
jgi:phage tail-like protein